jgi:hypothetical protein
MAIEEKSQLVAEQNLRWTVKKKKKTPNSWRKRQLWAGYIYKKCYSVGFTNAQPLYSSLFILLIRDCFHLKKDTFPLELRSSNSWFLFYPLIKKKKICGNQIFCEKKEKLNFFLLPFFGFIYLFIFTLTHYHLRKGGVP